MYPDLVFRNARALLISSLFLGALPVFAATFPSDTTIQVDTKTKVLRILSGTTVLREYPNISIGRRGTGSVRYQGDDKTPLGIFYISWINADSRFNRFYGLDFPKTPHALKALEQHRVTQWTFTEILDAQLRGDLPPQSTQLGGRIGIHGVGIANAALQGQIDWTQGCIALTDQQISDLSQWVGVGTKVEIK